jgi:hypothetical protein
VAVQLIGAAYTGGELGGAVIMPEASLDGSVMVGGSDVIVTAVSGGVILHGRYAFTMVYSDLVAEHSDDRVYDFDRFALEAGIRGWGGAEISVCLVPYITMLDGPSEGWRDGFGVGFRLSYAYFGFRVAARWEQYVFAERVESGSVSGCWDTMSATGVSMGYEYLF